MKKLKQLIMGFALVFGIGTAVLAGPVASAANPISDACANNPDSALCKQTDDASKVIGLIVNTLLFAVGVISVVMIIVGGIIYATSGGDSSGVTKGKNTVLYAVVGLVVAFLAYAIVNWVLHIFG